MEGRGEEAAPCPRPTSILSFLFFPARLNHKTSVQAWHVPVRSQLLYADPKACRVMCPLTTSEFVERVWRGLDSPKWLPDVS